MTPPQVAGGVNLAVCCVWACPPPSNGGRTTYHQGKPDHQETRKRNRDLFINTPPVGLHNATLSLPFGRNDPHQKQTTSEETDWGRGISIVAEPPGNTRRWGVDRQKNQEDAPNG